MVKMMKHLLHVLRYTKFKITPIDTVVQCIWAETKARASLK
jgi:hypothetical protein